MYNSISFNYSTTSPNNFELFKSQISNEYEYSNSLIEYFMQSFTYEYSNNILNVLSFLSIFFGVYTIISKNPIISVLFLIGLFTSISLYLIFSGLPFIGLSYLLVYVGAISILFIFILMLINIRVSELVTDTRNSIPLAIITILFINFFFYKLIPNTIENYNIINMDYIINFINYNINYTSNLQIYTLIDVKNIDSTHWDNILLYISHISSIGNLLYTMFFIHFIILSFILLLAMIGAILITINRSYSSYVIS